MPVLTASSDFYSGGASAMKEPGHFVVRKFSSQVRSPGVPNALEGLIYFNGLADLGVHWPIAHAAR